ncbi:MAG: glycosyltransferase [Flavobacteriales bacterium]|nr:glycosyltransferase [Flavobacteriales bacterium]
MNSKVSVIMPALNVEDYIGEAIDSMLLQEFENWELIIIDNGSVDQTVQIIRTFKDERIILIHESNKGISVARNAGLRIASGEFLCFLDADDRLPKNSLSTRVQFLQQNPTISFCDGLVTTSDESYTMILGHYKPSIQGDVHQEMALFQPKCFAGVTWMIRRSTLGSLTFSIDWQVMEDRIFFFQLSEKGHYGFVDHLIYEIRRRRNSSMSATALMEKHYLRFIREIQQQVLPKAVQQKEIRLFHSIFFKTYFKELRLISALRHFISLMKN